MLEEWFILIISFYFIFAHPGCLYRRTLLIFTGDHRKASHFDHFQIYLTYNFYHRPTCLEIIALILTCLTATL